MYTPNLTTTKNRCSLCYTLLSKYPTTTTTTTTTHSNIGYSLNSSSNRRYTTRCSISSIERLISSSRKLQKLWHKNANNHVHLRSICFRCCETIGQIDQIQDHIEQLNDEQNILLNKIEHHLSKRALILQGQKQRTYSSHSSPMNHQQTPIDNDDDDTEEGEEKPRTVIKTNGHGHSSSSIVSTTTLVGAKRRKSKVAHKINLENRSGLLNHASQSSPLISQSMMKYSPNLLFDSHSSKHHRSNPFSSGINGHNHDLTNLSFGSAYKSLALPTSTNVSAATPPFIDPTTGALIAIVSNPHHAALLAQQHQQMFKPLSTNTIDEHEHLPTKTQQQTQSHHPKKFPCLLCGRDFSNKSNLNRHHSIVHVAIRNFECARCPKKFKLRQGLKTHMQRCHGVNTDEPTFVLQKHHHSSFAQSK